MKSSVIVLAVLFVFNLFEINLADTCPDFEGVDDFEISRIVGNWHLIKTHDSININRNLIKCFRYQITRKADDESALNFNLTFVSSMNSDEPQMITTNQIAIFEDLSVGTFHFNNDDDTIHTESTAETMYHIMATNYFSYMIIWVCDTIQGTNIENETVLVFTRQLNVSQNTQALIDEKLDEHFPGVQFTMTDQSEEGCRTGNSSSIFQPSSYLICTILAICHFLFNKF